MGCDFSQDFITPMYMLTNTNEPRDLTFASAWTAPAVLSVVNKDSHSVIQALIKQSRKLPKELYRSLTWDRGTEMAGHKKFTLATDIDVFLCEPHSPWQRGTNENTNRLLRQYFPKGTDLSIHSQAKLSAVARQLNERPQKTLGYETPAERFNACVASTR
jgi:IS30 family transposase